MKKIISFFILTLFISSCSNKSDKSRNWGVGLISISNDDKNVLVTYYDSTYSTILNLNLNNKIVENIFKLLQNKYYISPRISKDDKKIVFYEFNHSDKDYNLSIADIDGNNKEVIMKTSDVQNPFLCENDTDILLTEYSEFSNSSPIAKKSSHGFDIYKINRFTKKVKKISKLNSYLVYVTCQVNKNSFLSYSYDENGGGIFLFDENKEDTLIRISENKKRKKEDWLNLFYDPLLHVKSGYYIYSNNWGILKMDTKGNVSIVVEHKEGSIVSFDIFHNIERIAYTIESDPNHIYFVNFDGTERRKIFIKSPLASSSS